MRSTTRYEGLEALLTDVFGAHVVVAKDERVDPWFVRRLWLEGDNSAVPPSVIVKSLRQDPAGFRTDVAQVLTERAALEFLVERAPGLAPRLIAHDGDTLVLEDLGPRRPLFRLLIERGESRCVAGLLAFARTMAGMHAATVGHDGDYYARRRALGPVDPQIERERFLGWSWREAFSLVASVGVELSAAAEEEFGRVLSSLRDPGPFLAFSNGDMAANNFLLGEDHDGRIIDFEFAGYRNVFTDLVCFYVPSPAFMTVGDPVAKGVEIAYRTVLSTVVPEIDDDGLFAAGIGAASIAMALARVHRLPTLDARPPGHESRRQMISTLEHAARASAALPHLAGWARAAAVALRARWPDADVDLASLPAYAERR